MRLAAHKLPMKTRFIARENQRTPMKPSELRELAEDELVRKKAELKDQLFKLRFQHELGQLENDGQAPDHPQGHRPDRDARPARRTGRRRRRRKRAMDTTNAPPRGKRPRSARSSASKMTKTVTVQVERQVRHPLYKKIIQTPADVPGPRRVREVQARRRRPDHRDAARSAGGSAGGSSRSSAWRPRRSVEDGARGSEAMIQQYTMLKVADNSGARRIRAITPAGRRHRSRLLHRGHHLGHRPGGRAREQGPERARSSGRSSSGPARRSAARTAPTSASTTTPPSSSTRPASPSEPASSARSAASCGRRSS